MKCTFDKDLVFEFAVGEVSQEQRRDVDAHLAHCETCRMEVAGHRQLARELAALPEPAFPLGLEEVLVRATVQSRRSQASDPARVRVFGLRPSWALALGSLAGVAVLVLLVLLLWPGRLSTGGPVDQVVGGGLGQGVGLLEGVFAWIADLQAAWAIASEFLGRLSPVGKAVRLAFGSVGGTIWAALAMGVLAAVLFLWRIAGAGSKRVRSVGHAKSR